MTELSKRIYTSFALIIIFTLSIYNNFILAFILTSCSYLIFYEFFNLLKKFFSINKNIKIYFSLLLILLLNTYLIIFIWHSLNSNLLIDKIFLLLLISVSVTSDIGGYIFGKIIKGKKLTKISPNKTYAGMFGAYLTSLLFSTIFFDNYFIFYKLISIIIISSTISQIGDIFISYLKRKNNFKDTGKLLPGHGGLLDRFDGIFFTIIIGSNLKYIL
tara:strand:- start:362 stop:1009 length:648 start_codon:yes stop_codon:yes gene_type:complete